MESSTKLKEDEKMAKRLRFRKYASIVICLLLVGMLSSICLSNIPLVNASPGGTVINAGCRQSIYGIDPAPSNEEWEQDMKIMASNWPGSTPSGVWIVGILSLPDKEACRLEFPAPDNGDYPYIIFENVDRHENYLDYFDTHGIKVWLQVEPAFADLPTLIDLVLDRYEHHECVIGFGVDVEWHQYKAGKDRFGVEVTDEQAENWEAEVKLHNEDYTLFLKHFWYTYMPPVYRGDIIFVDDSQGFSSLSDMVTEFRDMWAIKFYPNIVGFQYGYEADQNWWSQLNNPPKDIGDAIAAEVEQDMGLFWVDFTLRDVFPPEGSDNTPPVIENVATSDVLSYSATITWDTDEPCDSAINYGTTTALGSTKKELGIVTAHSITLTGLSGDTKYYFEVQSADVCSNTTVDDNNGSYYTFTTPEADITPPAAPTGLTATAVSHSRIDLDWNNNTEEDLDHYNVYRSTTSGFNCDNSTFLDEATVSDYPDTSVDDNTTYYYKVTAVDTSNNESDPSNEANATTPEAPAGPTMHVLRIDMELLHQGQSYQGKAIVYIVDENDNAVPSATVYGHWEGISPSGTQDKDTDAEGAAPFWSGKERNPPSGSVFKFVVDNVAKEGWTYDPGSNVETEDNVVVP